MRNRIETVGMVAGAALVCTAILTSPSHALTKCKASVRGSDGVIVVNAATVGGPLQWGTAQGSETNAFANAVTCLKGTAAVGCQLGAPGTPEQITPPQLCKLFLSDGVGSCAAHIHGCTPGLRPPIQIQYVDCTGATATGGGQISSCTATCPAGTHIVGGVCANVSSPQAPQFTQGLISDPGTDTTWSCTVRNQNQVSTPGTIAAQGTAICE